MINATTARLRVYVLPDLRLLPGGTGTLADFPDFLDWRATLATIKLSVSFGNGKTVGSDKLALTLRAIPPELSDFNRLQFESSLGIDDNSARLDPNARRQRSAKRLTFDPKNVTSFLRKEYRFQVHADPHAQKKPQLVADDFQAWTKALHEEKNPPATNTAKPGDAAKATTFRHIIAGLSRYPVCLELCALLFDLSVQLPTDPAGAIVPGLQWVQVVPTWTPKSPYAADVCPRSDVTDGFTLAPIFPTTTSGRQQLDLETYELTQLDLVKDSSKAQMRLMRDNADLEIVRPSNFGISVLWSGFAGAGGYLDATTNDNSPQQKYAKYLVQKLSQSPLPTYQQLLCADAPPGTNTNAATLQRGWALRVASPQYDTNLDGSLNYHRLCNRVTTIQLTNTAATVTQAIALEEGWVSVNDITQTGSQTPLHFPAIGHWRMTGMLTQPSAKAGPNAAGQPTGNATGTQLRTLPVAILPKVVGVIDGARVSVKNMPQRFGFDYHLSIVPMLYDGAPVLGTQPDDENTDPTRTTGTANNLVTTFLRMEPIDPPVIWARSLGKGETTDVMVIFDGRGKSTRTCYPPSVGRVLAERHGLLDVPPAATDLQMFGSGRPDEGSYSNVLLREHQVLPESGNQARPLTEAPYIPDPLAKGFQIVALADISYLQGTDKAEIPLVDVLNGTYPSADGNSPYSLLNDWPHVAGASLTLKAGAPGSAPKIDADTVALAPGDEAIIAIASSVDWDSDPQTTILSMRPRAVLAALQQIGALSDAARSTAMMTATTRSSNPNVTPPRMVRLVHAVQIPNGPLGLVGVLSVQARNANMTTAAFSFVAEVPGKTARDFRITANWTEWSSGSDLRPPVPNGKHGVLVSVPLTPDKGWSHGLADAQLHSEQDLDGDLAAQRTFDFGTTRAIRLSGVQLHAASRFSAYYQMPVDPTKVDAEHPFDLNVPSDPPTPPPIPSPAADTDVIVPATQGPLRPPLVAFVLPLVDRSQDRDPISGSIRADWRGRSVVLHLATWLLSGDDEELIVQRDYSYIYRNPSSDSTDAAPLPPLTDDSAWDFGVTTFQDATSVRYEVAPPAIQGRDYFTATVTIRPKTPAAAATSPWIRLSVATFQPHCIDTVSKTGPSAQIDFMQLSDDRHVTFSPPSTTNVGLLTVRYPDTRHRITVEVQACPVGEPTDSLAWRPVDKGAELDTANSSPGISIWRVFYQEDAAGMIPSRYRIKIEEFEPALAGVKTAVHGFDEDVGRRRYLDIIPLVMQ